MINQEFEIRHGKQLGLLALGVAGHVKSKGILHCLKKTIDFTRQYADNLSRRIVQMEVGPKHSDVRLRVEKGLQAKLIRFSLHSEDRVEERILQAGLVVEDVFKVLRKGKYVPEADEWSPDLKRWA